ncbi:TonB-dependent receptor [Microbulbifer sp. Q7]|uniref:TonB-dependent receptor n=1 Tax=Microbulbifer sp. Q7 TaxID=1785091 RepID=UPI000830FD3C|nr:TonB-dependent receptor [Microbulbifer sp. Q7]
MKRKLLPATIALVASQAAIAQTIEHRASEKLGDSQLEEVTVTGQFGNELRSLERQRDSDKILNVVSADGIGKLPDRNAAEAVQRIPGVSIERDQGEGRFVAIRGLPAQWSSASVNGHRLPTAEEETTSRATAFDFFPSELIERVEVSKAVTADQEGDAIGGNVNFITRTAPKERTFDISVAGGVVDKADGDSNSLNLLWGDRSADGKFGYIVNATSWKRDWATDNFEPRRKDTGIYRLEMRDYTGERETYGLNAGMEYNLDNGDKLFARGLYGTLEDDETHYKHRLRFDKDRLELQHIRDILVTEMRGLEFGGEHFVSEQSKLDWSIASYDNRFYYGDYPNGNDNSYFVARFDQTGVGYEGLDEGGQSHSEIDGGTSAAGRPDTHLPDDFEMDPTQANLAWVELYKIDVREKDRAIAQVDLTTEFSDDLELKFGVKYRDKERIASFSDEFYQWDEEAFGPAPVLSDFDLRDQPGRDDYLTEVGGNLSGIFSPVASTAAMQAFWNANRDKFRLVESESALVENGGALGRNFDVRERHLSGYGMGTYHYNHDLTLVAGLRLTQTNTRVDGQVLVENDEEGTAELVDNRGKKNYLSVLPSLHMKYALDDDSNLRFAMTRTFARPDFGDSNPGGTFVEHDNEFSSGNADLEPTYSLNLDLMYERYFEDGNGVVSAGLFYKDITDPVFRDASEGDYNGNSGVDFFRPENGDNASLTGLEFNVVRKLDFLPGALENLGVSANLTLMDSEMRIPDREGKVAIPRQADQLHNISVFYDDGALSLRLAQNHKGDYIEEHATSRSEDTGTYLDSFYGEYTSLDFSASYLVSDKLTVFAEANNLTNEPLTYYLGDADRPKQVEYYGWRAQLGVNYRLF